MKARLNVLLTTAGIGVILLTGCVSSKKYKASQASLQQVRNDSARLAQQVASLNENVHAAEEKNTALQRSLDSTSSNYTAQQKNLDYYQSYFKQQQDAMSQVGDQLKSALSQAGLSNDDVQQTNNTLYVNLDENKVFKKNSTVVTSSGKQALNSLAEVIKNRSDVNVLVSDGDSSSGQSTATGNMPSGGDNTTMSGNAADNGTAGNMSSGSTPRHRRPHHDMAARKSAASKTAHDEHTAAKSANDNVAANTPTPNKDHTTPVHKRAHRKYSSEGSTAFYSGPKSSKNRYWALKQGRMNTVANSFLQSGVPKVNISLRQPALNANEQNSSNNIKVVITPAMNDFNPQKTASAGR